MRTDTEAQNRVRQMIRREDFPAVVHRLGVNRGLVYRVWKDGIHSPTVRRALGLPPKTVPVEPCADCGEVHTQHKQCSDERSDTKRTKANGWHRRAGWLDDDWVELYDEARRRTGMSTEQVLMEWADSVIGE